MDTHLDGGSSAPLYQQVLDLLKSDIEQGTYPVDSQIPTELELSKMYGVGRVTVRRAIEELVGEGYLTKRQGRGTFVTATKIIRKVHQKDDVQSFTQACAENGMKAGARVVARKTVAADRDLASFFGLDEGSDLILVSRVRTADGVPVLFENNYYPVDGFEFLKDIGLSNCSIFEAVGERTGRYPCSSDPCRLEIARAGIDTARELKVPVGEPLFFMNAGFLDSNESASAMAGSTTWVRATASISSGSVSRSAVLAIAATGPFSA